MKKLLAYENLEPILCVDSEWNEVGKNVFQNKRLSSVFKDSKNEDPYFLDAIVFKRGKNDCYTGSSSLNGKTIYSRQNVKIPFIPKTFYIDVDESGSIVNPKQLTKVFRYYAR